MASATPCPEPDAEDVERLVRRVAGEARRYGLTPAEMARRLCELEGDGPGIGVAVVECSLAQCRDHVEEVEARFAVDATPWPLDLDGEPPPGPVVATYFHYGDVVRRWPHRREDVLFVAVRPDPALVERVLVGRPEVGRVLACELDEVRAANLAADLEPLFAGTGVVVEPAADGDAARVLERGDGVPVCFAPRAWATLDDDARRREGALRVRYVIDDQSLAVLAGRLPAGRRG